MQENSTFATKEGKNMKMLGIITILMGVIAILVPVATGLSVVLFVGLLVVAGGLLRMFWAFKSDSVGAGAMTFAIGGLTFLCGLALVTNPMFLSGFMTFLLVAYLIIDSVFEVTAALRIRPQEGWGWMMTGGIFSFVLGILLWAQFPVSGAMAVGVILGVKLVFVGIIILGVGSEVRAAAKI